MDVQGIDYLVTVIGDFVRECGLVLIAGHPGSGKTTISAFMCVHALQNGCRSLYISFQEDKERLFNQLANVGVELKFYEDRGLFRFVKFPVPGNEEVVRELFDGVSKILLDFKPKVVVVDSVTAVLESFREDAKVRVFLQNYFWELQRSMNATVVLISEIPPEQEHVGLGGSEFVADAVLVLKRRIVRGLVTRYMEVRKVRGHELTVAEIPFSIRSGKGLEFYPPTIPSEIKAVKKRRLLFHSMGVQVVEAEGPASTVYIDYPPELSLSPLLLYTVLTYIAGDDGRILFVEYNFPEEHVKTFLEESLRLYGADEVTVKYVLDRVVVASINPTAYSATECLAKELTLIEEVNPSAVIFHDVSIFSMEYSEDLQDYTVTLFNELLNLKRKGIGVVRCGSRVDPKMNKLSKLLADHFISAVCADKLCSKYVLRIVTKGKVIVISSAELENHIKKVVELLRGRVESCQKSSS